MSLTVPREWLERVREALRAEWHGAAPDASDLEAQLVRARGREVARTERDRVLLAELLRVRRRISETDDATALEALDGVISTLDARCSI